MSDQFAADPQQDPDQAEREALGRIVHAFREYRADAEWEIARWEHNYSRLSDAHKTLVPNLPVKIAAARQCAYQNHLFLKSLLSSFTHGNAPPALADANEAAEEWALKVNNRVNPADADKVRYVFKNLMRDWSAEGAAERAQSYGRITAELERLFPNLDTTSTLAESASIIDVVYTKATPTNAARRGRTTKAPPPAVLVPGTGLGRLCAEIAGLGFESIGNEFSYYMLLTSTFILNNTQRAEQFTIHPWLHSACNQLSDGDQLRSVLVPDIEPIEIVSGGGSSNGTMGMCAGDFVEVFKHEDYREYFDAVATCFFLDTANNVIEYMEVIWQSLKPGGYWLNFGPLLWHWAESHTYLPQAELSIELSLRDIERIAQQMGFVIEKKEMVHAAYMSNKKSLLRQEYDCVFWTARKPLETRNDSMQTNGNGSS